MDYCCRRLPSCPENKCCRLLNNAATPLLCFLMVASVAAGILASELVLHEHLNSKHFVIGECIVKAQKFLEHLECHAQVSGGGYAYSAAVPYSSTFPCYQVLVRIKEQNGTEDIGVLHSSAAQLKEYPSCSESVCNRQIASNIEFIDRFLSKWPLNHVSSCAYNPTNPKEVLVDIHYTETEAIHAILWPSLVFTISLVILIVRCVKGSDPCAQKVKQWDPVTLRTLKESCMRKLSCVCPCCKPKNIEDDSPTEETGRAGHENIAFDKF